MREPEQLSGNVKRGVIRCIHEGVDAWQTWPEGRT